MENKKQRLLTVLWILVAAITRILYFLYDSRAVVDTYGYYAHAMLGTGEGEPVLTSGAAYAYTNHLSKILPYLENGTTGIGVYHLILQILWLVFLIIGMGILFGGMAQFLTGGILIVSPQILESIFVVSPENYYMFHFSLLFLALALFFGRTKKRGWYRSSFGESYLMLVGFWLGVICIWNYIGWFLIPVMIHILNRNRYNLKDRIWEQKQKEIYLERQQVMTVGSQSSILTVGILLGMYSTLMKYTGMTGIPVGEQFLWWTAQYSELPERCQDIVPQLAVWLLFAGVTGILCSMMIQSLQRRKLQNMMYEDEVYPQEEKPAKEKKIKEKKVKEKKVKEKKVKEEKASPEKPGPQEREPQFTITEDGRKIELLDNPLPVPKKHEKKEMDFKLSDFPDESATKADTRADTDEFDLGVMENDDFDV